MYRSSVHDTGVLASDNTFKLESRRLGSGLSTGIMASPSDIVLLFFDGDMRITTGDRVHNVTASAQAYVNAGIGFEIVAGDTDVSYLVATCPASGLGPVPEHDPEARTGGVTVLRTDRYDRFPDSGHVRGGMFYLDEGKIATYHSHDAAAEVFVFLKGGMRGQSRRPVGAVLPGRGALCSSRAEARTGKCRRGTAGGMAYCDAKRHADPHFLRGAGRRHVGADHAKTGRTGFAATVALVCGRVRFSGARTFRW